jgi:hypothetical protein
MKFRLKIDDRYRTAFQARSVVITVRQVAAQADLRISPKVEEFVRRYRGKAA